MLLPRRRVKTSAKMFSHPVFDVDQQGPSVMRLYPTSSSSQNDFEEGVWLSRASRNAIETSKGHLSVPVPVVGKFLVINNLFWLHGRDQLYSATRDLRRELDASAWLFAYASNHYQTHQ